MKINKSINVKIGVYFFITNLFLVVLLGSIFYFSSSNLLIRKDTLAATEAIQRSGNYIELYINKLTSISKIMSQDLAVYEFLKEKKENERGRILHMIENIRSTDPNIKSIILIRKDGAVISNEKNINMEVSSDMMKEEWYVEALKTSMVRLNPLRKQNFASDNMDQWVVSVSQEIHDEAGNNLGVLLLDVKYQALHEYLQERELGGQGETIIVDKQDRLVYYKDLSKLDEGERLLADFKSDKEGYNIHTNTIMVKYPIKNTHWTLIANSSLKEITSLKIHLCELLLISCLASVVIIMILNAFILKRITRPIQQLEKHMRDFSSNLSKISLDGDVSIEILSLQNHFNDMIERIKYLREYEINALHSQINPHFLYNTLDTIIWMAEFQDTEKVISITKSLANFFRISLSNGKEKIPLREEIKHIQEYLYIQKQRYEEKLEYSFDIQEELEEMEVPKIILQPLVENAIYHGIKNIDGIGKIHIYSRILLGKMELIIEDNGIGFETSKKQTIFKMDGVGINNVKKRIQFYYGEDSGVFVDESIDKGARVIIRLPYKK